MLYTGIIKRKPKKQFQQEGITVARNRSAQKSKPQSPIRFGLILPRFFDDFQFDKRQKCVKMRQKRQNVEIQKGDIKMYVGRDHECPNYPYLTLPKLCNLWLHLSLVVAPNPEGARGGGLWHHWVKMNSTFWHSTTSNSTLKRMSRRNLSVKPFIY
jgi:hypothetical protein